MATVDTSIYNALIRPIKSVDEWRDEAALRDERKQRGAFNALQMQHQQMQMGQAQRAMRDDETLRSALAGLQPGAGDDARIQAYEGTGLPAGYAQADAVRKAGLERQKTQADLGKTNAETQAKWAALMKDRIRGIMANPTPEAMLAYITEMEQVTGRPATQDRQFLAQAKRPEDFKRYALAVDQGADKVLAKLQTTDYGGYKAHEALDVVTGEVTRTGQVENTQTKDNAASNARMAADAAAGRAVTMRGQNMSDARAKELGDIQRAAARAQVIETPDGVMIVDKGTGLARPAATFDGKVLPGKDTALNETQSKALAFGDRMRQNGQIIESLERRGTSNRGAIKATAETVGRIAGLGTDGMGGTLADTAGAMTNWTQSAEQQQYEAAKRNWIAATLRKESGAAIGAGEYRDADNQYFPQPGDDRKTAEQKRALREAATKNMLAEVPSRVRPKAAATIESGADLGGGFRVK